MGELEAVIAGKIGKDGPMTFRDFMGLALYHPQYGYYTSGKERIGKNGDFYTSPHASALFGRLISRRLREMWEALGKREFTIVELGAGKGLLCLDMLEGAREASEFYRNLRYVIIERRRPSIESQKEALKDFINDGKVVWAKSLDEIAPFSGCVISNEFFDALPVHVVEMKKVLREIYVDFKDGKFIEVTGKPSTSSLVSYFKNLGIKLGEGQRAEVNLDAINWMKAIGSSLKGGFVITIDYGYPSQELFSPSRKRGTLLCYHRHRVNENPYENIGGQDITSHVDFTSLEMVGKAAGLETLSLTDQTAFLLSLGAGEEMEKASREHSTEGIQKLLSLKRLVSPAGMGKTFKVLIQHKGLKTPKLRGLSMQTNQSLISI